MGILDFLRIRTFIGWTSEDFARNQEKQLLWSNHTLDELSKFGVNSKSMLKLEYFFYCSSEKGAKQLVSLLVKRNDYTSSYHKSSNGNFCITGWSGKLRMDEKSVKEWIVEMCELGASNNCMFDGFGTNPNQ